MLIIGLTGSIGMGKSTVSQRFAEHGVKIFDADKAVHDLYEGPAAAAVETAFPGVVVDGHVDRQKLSKALRLGEAGEHKDNFAKLEAIIHPKVRELETGFLQACYDDNEKLAILEIPLFFETEMDNLVDMSIVVIAPAAIRNQRVLSSRPHLIEETLQAIVEKQMPDEEKCKRADYIIHTDGSFEETFKQVDAVYLELVKKAEDRPNSQTLKLWDID